MTYHKKELKDKICEAAYNLINEKGYQNTSLRMIAKKLNVSSTAIYRHYKNAEDLMRHVIQKGENHFSKYLIKNLNHEDSLLTQITMMAKNYIQYCVDFPFLYDFLFMSEFTPITSQDNMMCDMTSQGIECLVHLLNRVITIYKLNETMETLFTQLWAYIQGYAYLVRFHNFVICDALIQKSIRNVMGGIQ